MNSEFEIRSLYVKDRRTRLKVEAFLADNDLRLDTVEQYFGIFRLEEDDILAAGGLYHDIIKCVAVRQDMREERLFNMLVSHLMSVAMQNGYFSTKVYTKPENLDIFNSLGFKLIAQSPHALFMENSLTELNRYKAYLAAERSKVTGSHIGLVIMNANPFTKGHRYLVEQASAQVNHLFVIVVKENLSLFDYRYRLEMVTRGCSDLANVTVLEGSGYQISAATFPTYFLKQVTDATDEHIRLDLDVCLRHIAPNLTAPGSRLTRFAGSEPTDPLTARYNQLMRQILPPQGVDFVEIPRLEQNGQAVSASALRNTYDLTLLHPTSLPYAIGVFAAQALRQELDLTPKPGLIDHQDNGAHGDMNHALMLRSIRTIEPYLIQLADMGCQAELPAVPDIIRCGLKAEKAMLAATGGINTHKGAIFSLGLFCIAAANSFYHLQRVSPQLLQAAIKTMAQEIPSAHDTHGAHVRQQYRVKGALDLAVEGYCQLFEQWLPFYRQHITDDHPQLRLLLIIISTLDDNNLYHRGGEQLAHEAQQRCAQVLQDFSIENIQALNDWMKARNLSPGGSADMLALTLFAAHLIHNI